MSDSGMYLSGYSHLDLNGSQWNMILSGVWISLDANVIWISLAFGYHWILPLGSPWVSVAFGPTMFLSMFCLIHELLFPVCEHVLAQSVSGHELEREYESLVG